jgi:hypothetical protein
MDFETGGEWVPPCEHSLSGKKIAQAKTIAAINRTLCSIGISLTRIGLQDAVKKGGMMRPISYRRWGECRKRLH